MTRHSCWKLTFLLVVMDCCTQTASSSDNSNNGNPSIQGPDSERLPIAVSRLFNKQQRVTQGLSRIAAKNKMSSDSTLGKSYHISSKEVARQKWVALNVITYMDPKGQERKWEGVSRTTKQDGEADAVCMLALFHDPIQDCKCVILICQYRPAMEAYTIEFPAGLIDKGESAEQAAVREMKEETGYDVKVSSVSPATALDPGLGSTTLKLAKCEVDTSTLGPNYPEPTGGGGDEFVTVIVQPLSTLNSKFQEFAEKGYIIDSRVYSWAMAMDL